MARKFIERPPEDIEDIVKESLSIIGEKLNKDKIKLLTRLIISGIAYYYFINPDNVINLGFLTFQKSPDKDELFKVGMIRDIESGVTNAGTLWKYYKGELKQEAQFKEAINNFFRELIDYSQGQEIEITKLTSKIGKRKGEKNGI